MESETFIIISLLVFNSILLSSILTKITNINKKLSNIESNTALRAKVAPYISDDDY